MQGGRRLIGLLLALAAAAASARGQDRPRGTDAFFVPSRQEVADAMLRLAAVSSSDVVVDLGSGDGRVVILAAERYGARGIGVEIDAVLAARAREAAREAGVASRVRFIEGDLFAADLSEATVVTLYLSTMTTRRLAEKLRRELRPGARIVSQQFDFGEAWPADARARHDGADLFLWRVPQR